MIFITEVEHLLRVTWQLSVIAQVMNLTPDATNVIITFGKS